MARLRIPTQKQIDLYNQLVENQNKVRKALIRLHKRNEEASGAGRLPALIIPKKARKINSRMFQGLNKEALRRALQRYWSRYRDAKSLFGSKNPLNKYVGRVLVQGYRDLWIEQIGITPEGRSGKYTEEQIENSDLGEFMETFNLLFARGREMFFLGLLYTGQIVQFKYIYIEMTTGQGTKENSWLAQQKDMATLYLNRAGRLNPTKVTNLYNQASIEQDDYTHTKNTMKKARAEQREDEEREARIRERAEKAKGGK